MDLFVWAVIALLIAINALYVAAEFAAVGVRRGRIRQMAEDGHPLARRLTPILEDPAQLDRYIAACQIGITFSSLVLGAYGQATLAEALTPYFAAWGGLQAAAAQSTAAVAVLLALTALQMVLGELVPKSLALQYPTPVALYTVLPMRWSQRLLSGFVAFLNGSGTLILRLLGAAPTGHRHIHSPQEIEMLLAESRDGGLLEPDEQQRLHRALLLGSRPAHQLMVPRRFMAALSIDTPPQQLLRRVAESPYTRLPVYRGSIDNVVGLIHTKDVLVRYLEDGTPARAEDLMRPMTFISETVSADRLIWLLRSRHSRQAIVVDEYGGVSGLITVENILREVLGQPQNEPVPGQPPPERLPDGRIRLPGLMRLRDAEAWVGAPWDGSSDTVSGFVIEQLGHLPVPGERLERDGAVIEVEQVEARTITAVLVTVPPPAAEEGEQSW